MNATTRLCRGKVLHGSLRGKVPILGYPQLVAFGISLAVKTKFKLLTRTSKFVTFSLNLSFRECPGDRVEIKVVGLVLLRSPQRR